MDKSNIIDSPGLFERNHQLYLGLITGQATDPRQIANIFIKNTQAGAPIHVGDVATVEPAYQPQFTIVSANGKPAVLINVTGSAEATRWT